MGANYEPRTAPELVAAGGAEVAGCTAIVEARVRNASDPAPPAAVKAGEGIAEVGGEGAGLDTSLPLPLPLPPPPPLRRASALADGRLGV